MIQPLCDQGYGWDQQKLKACEGKPKSAEEVTALVDECSGALDKCVNAAGTKKLEKKR
jgi:hypothetical protein